MTSNDPYNIAIQYLINKYGIVRVNQTSEFTKLLRNSRSRKQSILLYKNITDIDFILSYKEVPKDNYEDSQINLLIKQYYLGIYPKIELKNKLQQLKII